MPSPKRQRQRANRERVDKGERPPESSFKVRRQRKQAAKRRQESAQERGSDVINTLYKERSPGYKRTERELKRAAKRAAKNAKPKPEIRWAKTEDGELIIHRGPNRAQRRAQAQAYRLRGPGWTKGQL